MTDFPRMPASPRRFVQFEYCISLLVVTIRRRSEPISIPSGGWGWPRGLPYSLISLTLGWWGVPWGLWWTPITLGVNLWGGHDVPPPVSGD